ncbi:MAG: glycosyltransferase [Patescibacteria group bacterium]|jgi:glycosyltransferase involved in cell wall biosynthesis
MKVALIHDHLAQDGGAEKVLEVFTKMFPQAPIYTLLYDKKNVAQRYPNRRIDTSIIQKMPGGVRFYQWYLPFMPMAVEFFDLRNYDLVLSDTSSFAKGVITLPETVHICYCHTPTRYLWSDTHQYINELKYNRLIKKIASLILSRIRIWDRLAADRVDYFIANSETVKNRIKKYYQRDSVVIYPPVEIDKFFIAKEVGDYFLIGCRLAPYKRVDIVVEAFKKMGENYKLKVFGDGVDLKRLKKIAGNCKNIEFLGRISDENKASLFSKCLAFINPQEEDFGISKVEAMASGRPVIAYKKGGALETIIENETGVFFEEQNAEGIVAVVQKFYTDIKDNKKVWDSYKIREHAKKFSSSNFQKNIKDFVDSVYTKDKA